MTVPYGVPILNKDEFLHSEQNFLTSIMERIQNRHIFYSIQRKAQLLGSHPPRLTARICSPLTKTSRIMGVGLGGFQVAISTAKTNLYMQLQQFIYLFILGCGVGGLDTSRWSSTILV